VTGLLIPIRGFTPHAIAAVRYALEFGKRNNARLHFLFVADSAVSPGGTGREDRPGKEEGLHPSQKEMEALIDAGKSSEGVQIEVHFRSGDFIQEVRQYVRTHYITEIVISLPEESEETFEQIGKDIQLLLKMTHCRILTVKQKSKG
jgi:nucleotide-binding universal stress UspA family protein